jgi:16S rRNA G966 N2-methylase RsmD
LSVLAGILPAPDDVGSPVTTLTLFPLEPVEGAPAEGASVSRATTVYGVHAYHTKVPVEGIEPYVRQHSAPGDTVIDPFCGSGMTGLAALRLGRRPLLSDLSPAAVHIAGNYTSPCNPGAYAVAVERVIAAVDREPGTLYGTSCHQCGRQATTAYVVWSDIRRCPSCTYEMRVWDQRETGLRHLTCTGCGTGFRKAAAPVVGEVAVSVNVDCKACGRLDREPTPEDVAKSQRSRSEIPYWYPRVPFGPDRAMWRSGHREVGIVDVADFYSPRNLQALAALWAAIEQEPDTRLRSALTFTFTAIANRASRRYQWNAKRPTNVLGGTLYVSSLRYEFNVFGLWRRKVAAVRRLFVETTGFTTVAEVAQASATALPYPSNSVDYCFTDPPFGGNIVYSDCSILWEAWLGNLTDTNAEAVMSHTGKGLDEYSELMTASFREIHRVLKPGAAATVVFQNTDSAVWDALVTSTVEAGFSMEQVEVLHKRQPSFKGVKAQEEGERVAASDVVLTLRRAERRVAKPSGTGFEPIWDAVSRELRRSDISKRQRSSGHLYAIAVAAAINAGIAATETTFEWLEGWLNENCVIREGGWHLAEAPAGV